MNCTAFCITSSYDLKALHSALRAKYRLTSYPPEAIHLPITKANGTEAHVFCFGYGAVVCWGMDVAEGRFFVEQFADYEKKRHQEEMDEFTFSYGENAKIVDEEIFLPDHEVMTMLAFSYAMGQSVKLGSFEAIIQRSFDATKHIPEELAKRGWVSLSRRAIRCQIGELFITRSSISMYINALDTPDFFWEYPEYEAFYRLMANHLDLKARVEALNARMKVVHELFEMLGNELDHQHSSRLEWTIIWLIIIEVILSLLSNVFRIF
jgi:uncharacterized Rmd1/YagE family protein